MTDTKKRRRKILRWGFLVCQEKSDALVELTLPENANIYASKYELYLPDKMLLQEKLKQWTQEENGNADMP